MGCFADKIRGVSVAGSGLKLRGDAVTESFCDKSQMSKCSVGDTDGVNIPQGSGTCGTSTDATCPVEYFPMQPQAGNNVAGKPLRWCLYMGCDDYLAHSVYGLAAYLEIIGSPFSLISYDAEHKAPTNWMTALDQCLGISATDTVTVKDGYDVTCKADSQFVLKGSQQGGEGGQQGGGGGQQGGGGAAMQCTEVLTRFC